jgi:hypothetical protein
MKRSPQELQIKLEQLFNKNQLMSRIKHEFVESINFNFIGYMVEKKIDAVFGVDLLAQMALHKRTSLTTLVGILRHHFNNDGQKTADAIYQAAEADLVDYDHNTRMFIVRFEISSDVQDELDRYQFPLPMVVRPLLVYNNKQTGYLTSGGSIILKHNHHDDDVCLDHINRMNAIPFTINQDTASMVQNKWRNLDKMKPGETKDDFNRRKKAFEKYDRTAKDVIGMLPETFYLTHKYDKRGRSYCQGYHVTYQGAPWNKAVIEFADQELVT